MLLALLRKHGNKAAESMRSKLLKADDMVIKGEKVQHKLLQIALDRWSGAPSAVENPQLLCDYETDS